MTRAKPLILGTGLVGLALVVVPGIDLGVARLFFLPGVEDPSRRFLFNGAPLAEVIHWFAVYAPWLLAAALTLSLLATVARRQPLLGLDRKQWLFLVLAMGLGPGLMVNQVLKDNWQRARPFQIKEFDGGQRFSPPLVISDQCHHNCSFVSGEAASGFYLTAFAYVARRRRRELFWAGMATGAVAGFVRIGQGAHFLSDVFFAGVLILGLTAALHALFWGRAATVAWWREVVLGRPHAGV